jgi:hypothetical protein
MRLRTGNRKKKIEIGLKLSKDSPDFILCREEKVNVVILGTSNCLHSHDPISGSDTMTLSVQRTFPVICSSCFSEIIR